MMKPKAATENDTGILEYLEDVIGSDKYVEAIKEKGAAVETLNEERAMKLNRVKATEGERENLEASPRPRLRPRPRPRPGARLVLACRRARCLETQRGGPHRWTTRYDAGR